jgi:protein ImuB
MFACIYVPDFPVAAIVRSEPSLRDNAVAVLEGKPPHIRVIALNDTARVMGIEIGMTKLQAAIFVVPQEASMVLPRLSLGSRRGKAPRKPAAAVLRLRSPEQEQSSHAALLDIAHAFTPRVEDTHHDRLLLDLDGLERLYGPAAAMARELASRIGKVGLECNIGLATNPDAAMHAACGFSGVTVLPAGEEARRLGVLPLHVVLDSFVIASGGGTETSAVARERKKLREQILDTLERWGVRDFRMLALLPEHALAARLGEAGTHLQQLSRGAAMRTLALCDPPVHFEEGMELDSAVETLEPLSFLLNRLLEQLCARLEARALAVQELKLRLQLEPHVADEQSTTYEELEVAQDKSFPSAYREGNFYMRTFRLPVAMRDPKVFLKLLQLDLAAYPPGAPVCKLWITAEPARPRSAQRGLFLPITPEAEKLEITLSRINAIVGERRTGIAKVLDTHRPDAFRMERFVVQPELSNSIACLTTSDTAETPLLALRILRPARQVRVQLAEGRPARLVMLAHNGERVDFHGTVLWSAGPWRSSGDWWVAPPKAGNSKEDAQAWSREEWDVAVAQDADNDVALYRIYRDIGTGRWFADASYD